MSITVRATKKLESALHEHIKPAILGLMLLAGCSTSDVALLTASNNRGAVCNSDTDTFCMENDQQKAARLNQQGLEFAAKQDYDKALELFKQVVALDSSNPEYYYHLGVAYSSMGMVAEEEAAYLAAVAIQRNPDNSKMNSFLVDAHYNLACLYALQGKKDQAFEQLDKLASLGANNAFHFIKTDKDLDSLRDDPRYLPALDKISNSAQRLESASPPSQ